MTEKEYKAYVNVICNLDKDARRVAQYLGKFAEVNPDYIHINEVMMWNLKGAFDVAGQFSDYKGTREFTFSLKMCYWTDEQLEEYVQKEIKSYYASLKAKSNQSETIADRLIEEYQDLSNKLSQNKDFLRLKELEDLFDKAVTEAEKKEKNGKTSNRKRTDKQTPETTT